MSFRDEAYLRDGLGLLFACDALLMGRRTYELNAKIWPGRTDPWANRLNAMPKYVFSSTLEVADWKNSTIVRDNAADEVAKLKQQDGASLLTWGHGVFAESLLQRQLIDVIDLSMHPVVAGQGRLFFRAGHAASLKLVATKAFSKIVKLTYEPQYRPHAPSPDVSQPRALRGQSALYANRRAYPRRQSRPRELPQELPMMRSAPRTVQWHKGADTSVTSWASSSDDARRAITTLADLAKASDVGRKWSHVVA